MLKSLIIIQKRAIHIITFLKPDEHSELLFKLTDLFSLYNAFFMYHYYYNHLPSSFEKCFQTVTIQHLLPNQPTKSIPSKQAMVNLTFALQL